jgi:hypothetical protein
LECPLDRSWRRWDLVGPARLNAVPADAQPAIGRSKGATPLLHLGVLDLAWEVAADDAANQPMTTAESGEPEWRWAAGTPRHIHAETHIDGDRLHVDWVAATKYGPLRGFSEIRIFVNGQLAGRGGRAGISLGGAATIRRRWHASVATKP